MGHNKPTNILISIPHILTVFDNGYLHKCNIVLVKQQKRVFLKGLVFVRKYFAIILYVQTYILS